MSIGNVIAILGAGMGGYMKGRQQKMDEDSAASDAEFKQWQRDQMKQQAARDEALRGDLAAAGSPVTMQEAAGKPDTMDNVDVGQDGEQPVAPNTFKVGNQTFNDPTQAQAAATAANAPAAQMQRVAAAYSKNGQAGMAMQVKRDAQQSELAQLGLDQKHMEIANEQFDNLLGQQASHDAIAAFVSKSQHDGQGGGLQIQAIPSADGKTVTYAKVNDDGSLTPTGHTYTNDAAGVEQAQLWLSKATPLSAKIGNLHQQAQDKLAADKETSEAQLRAAQAKYYDGLLDVKTLAAANKAPGGKAGLYDRMDESDKIELQNAYKASSAVDELINKGMADGSLTKDSDNYKFLTAKKAAADLKARNVLTRYADASAPAAAADPLNLRGGAAGGMAGAASQAGADTDAGVLMINNEFGGDLAKAQAYVTARRAEAASATGDARQIMTSEADRIQRGIDAKKAAPRAAAGAPAPAPVDATARRVVQTPVVNFAAPQKGSGNARVNAAASRIPALTAALATAKANLEAAKSKGPMAVSAARDAWNNAKTALAEANLRAGNTVAEDDTN